MSAIARTLLGILTVLCCSSPALANDLCVESGLASISPRKDCHTIDVKLVDGDSEYVVKMAQAFKEMKRDMDVIYGVNHFALRAPDGEVFYLGEFKPWVTSLFWLIWSRPDTLAMTRIYSATASTRGDEIFEKVLLKQGSRFCTLYRMKKPFLGEVKDCSGDYSAHIHNFLHNVHILPDVIPPSQAWLEACKAFLDGSAQFCGENYVNHSATIVRRTSDDKLNYVVELSNYFDDTKTTRKNRPNYLVYVIDPENRTIRFVSANEKNSGHKQLVEIGQ
ncbi:hypothetical protein [Dechloromonas denitrificans]|uniref:hypothetical protein n=1 Tax=Dechloromonas denitrificans TaxID=281362 RepID=UPI001CF8F1BB|nr:hypothetical protein [Dechloromonas denitrificans]UCV04919.1 hypothetical protein KI611_06580 [Dechloromonas denitrificans]